MTARYMVTYDIPSDRPNTGCVIHDDKQHYRIVVGNPESEEGRNSAAGVSVPLLQMDNPDASLEDVLSAYLGSSGYVDSSEWEDSPYSYEETVRRLATELQSLLHGAALERNARLANIVRTATETGVDLEPGNESAVILLNESGEHQRISQPGLGYPVPDEALKQQLIAELLGLDEETGEPKIVIVPNPEEVFSEREDVQGSEEGS